MLCPEAEAARQMKTLVMPDGKEQLSSKYLGTSAKRGALAKALKDTADFLREQKTIRAAATIGTIEKGINPSYLEKAVR